MGRGFRGVHIGHVKWFGRMSNKNTDQTRVLNNNMIYVTITKSVPSYVTVLVL